MGPRTQNSFVFLCAIVGIIYVTKTLFWTNFRPHKTYKDNSRSEGIPVTKIQHDQATERAFDSGTARDKMPRVTLPINYEETKRKLDVCKTAPKLWTPPLVPASLQGMNQRDPKLIDEIRKRWILSPDSKPLNLTMPNKEYFSQERQDRVLDRFFHNKTGGFFIECGALDGEDISNTLYFERERRWEGLLIEANPDSFQKIVSKHRKSYLLNACLSITQQANAMNFSQIKSHPYLSRLESGANGFIDARRRMPVHMEVTISEIQCFPFYSIFKALGVNHVDFFSLDVEGADWDVLQTIPFHEVNIDFLLLEIGDRASREEKIAYFAEYLTQFGYRTVDLEGGTLDIGMTRI